MTDSGATENLLPSRFAGGVTVRPSSCQFYAANGSLISTKGEATVSVRFSPTCTRRVKFTVSDQISEILLGVNFLKNENCRIDFIGLNDILQIDNEKVPLISILRPMKSCSGKKIAWQ